MQALLSTEDCRSEYLFRTCSVATTLVTIESIQFKSRMLARCAEEPIAEDFRIHFFHLTAAPRQRYKQIQNTPGTNWPKVRKTGEAFRVFTQFLSKFHHIIWSAKTCFLRWIKREIAFCVFSHWKGTLHYFCIIQLWKDSELLFDNIYYVSAGIRTLMSSSSGSS